METALEQILTSTYKDGMISYLAAHPEDFEEAIKLAISDKQPYSWRASWLLWSCMEENDPRIKGYVKDIIDTISEKPDSQQRELLMILQKMDLNKEYEGLLFSHCVTLWESINKTPSIRHKAFAMIVKIAKKHPGLYNEVLFLTRSQFMNTLSPGVKRSIAKMIKDFSQKEKQK